MSLRLSSIPTLVLLAALVVPASGCGDGGSDAEAGGEVTNTDGSTATTTATTAGALSASTSSGAVGSSSSPISSSSTGAGTSSISSTTSNSATSSTTGGGSEPDGLVTFASPSRNIICNMVEIAVDCYIFETEWTIEQPSDPDCEASDWGNAIFLQPDEVGWSCYTDFWFDFDAPALEYGDGVVVGEFRCDSARSGVTCRNGSGQGFTLARSEAAIF